MDRQQQAHAIVALARATEKISSSVNPSRLPPLRDDSALHPLGVRRTGDKIVLIVGIYPSSETPAVMLPAAEELHCILFLREATSDEVRERFPHAASGSVWTLEVLDLKDDRLAASGLSESYVAGW